MPDITIHTIETAPEEVKDVLQTVKDANGGYIPNLIGLLMRQLRLKLTVLSVKSTVAIH